MKILVVFTGGTIGSVVKDGWISPDNITKDTLQNEYKNSTGDFDTQFDATSPYWVLSENLSANELNLLIECVADNLNKDYDGIIITHGTDTLQYTASALAYAFSRCSIPIVLVSSAYPLADYRANGVVNFIGAVNFIASKSAGGVFVSYKNDNRPYTNIHTATRIYAHGEAASNVYSIDDQPFAFYNSTKNRIMLNPAYYPSATSEGLGTIKFCDAPHILMLNCRPGDCYDYDLDLYNAAIIAPYHSGTLNTSSEDFKAFCIKAKEKKVPVLLVNVSSGVTYESAKLFSEYGLYVLPFSTKISAYIKCWAAISLERDIIEFVSTPLAEEFVD